MWSVDEGEARRLLAELVAIDTTNPSLVRGGAGEHKAAEYLRKHLQELGLQARLDGVAPGRPNVIGVLPATAKDMQQATIETAASPFDVRHGLMINGHTDVVGSAGMDGLPFSVRFDGDRAYGRGAVDCKGGIVMGLLALASVKKSGAELQRSVLFTGVTDEEYASVGSEDVAKRYTSDAAVIVEPTGLSLCVAHKGFSWVTIETIGHAAHGSRYEEGIDAIVNMGKVLVEVDKMGKQYLMEEEHPLVGHRSIHASLVEGGKELSTYPDRCKAQFERRTLPDEDPRGIVQEMEAIIERLSAADPLFQARIRLDFIRHGYEVDREEPIVKALAAAASSVTGAQPAYIGSGGWMDSAVLGARGIPTVIFGPSGVGAHAREEWVLISSILTGAQVLAATIVDFCGRK